MLDFFRSSDRTRWSLSALLTAYVILQPLVDVLTSLGVQAEMPVTVGTVVRTCFVGAVFLYILFSGPYPGRKPALIYTGLLSIYVAVFAAVTLATGGLSYCMKNLGETLKVFYFPYTAVFLYTLYRQKGAVVSNRTIAAAGAGYCLIILLAYVTGTSFITYNSGYGYCGWFYSANDVSIAIMLTAPILVCLSLYRIAAGGRKLYLVWTALVLVALIFSASFIGTKLVYLGVLVYLAAAAVWLLVRYLRLRGRPALRCLLTVLLLCAVLIGLYPVSPLNAYVSDIYVPMSGDDPAAYEASLEIPGIVEVDRGKAHREMEEAAQGTWLGELINTNPIVQKADWILSRRLMILAPIVQEYLESGPVSQFIGLGYVSRPGSERDITHLIEMEGPALLLRHGLVGFALYYVPFLAVTVYLLIQLLRRFRHRLEDFTYCSLLYSVLMAFVTSMIAGHVLETPCVSLFVALLYEKLLLATGEQNLLLAQGSSLSQGQPF